RPPPVSRRGSSSLRTESPMPNFAIPFLQFGATLAIPRDPRHTLLLSRIGRAGCAKKRSTALRAPRTCPVTTVTDLHGHDLSRASPAVRVTRAWRGSGVFRLYRGAQGARAEAAIPASPGFAMAHLRKAWLNLLGPEPVGIDAARAARAAAEPYCRTVREKGHLA